MAVAKTAIRSAHLELWQSPSTGELLASLGESPTEKRLRISPFLKFLGDGELEELVSEEDSAALRNWVIQTLAKRTRSVKNPSIATRRDSRLIAALCAAPDRGTPRKWPENCLKIEGHEVLLWDVASRNHASLFPCASGMHGESAWPGRTNGGSTENLHWSQRRSLEPSSPAQRSAATQLGRRAQQFPAHHSGEDQSRFPLEGSSLSEGDPALAQIPRAFRAALFRV